MPERNSQAFPRHVGIIPDGNRRWARERNLPVMLGHERGLEQMRLLIDAASSLGIDVLTLWGFSTENWQRDSKEVDFLMHLFARFAETEWKKMAERDMRIRVFGDTSRLPTPLREVIEAATQDTASNTGLGVNFCLSYGGRDELLRATRKMLKEQVSPTELTEERFSEYLDSVGVPDLDLVIRTSGEQRLSGFMPWQSVYAELYFTPLYFPDFTVEEFKNALTWFGERGRRFGK